MKSKKDRSKNRPLLTCPQKSDSDKCGECPCFAACETEHGSFAELAVDSLNIIAAYEEQLERIGRYCRLTEKPASVCVDCCGITHDDDVASKG